MIGNDIVDLNLAHQESNWQRPRFLDKLFTKQERQFIKTSADKETAVWLLWSRKESAYKIIARLLQKRFFAPKKIAHTHLGKLSQETAAVLAFQQYSIRTNTLISDHCIHTIAQLDTQEELRTKNQGFPSQQITADCFTVSQDHQQQSHATRKQLLNNYSEMTNLPVSELSIQKDEWNIPHLYHQNQQQKTVISLAHHGQYGGYALLRS